jgi:acyl dehydratase
MANLRWDEVRLPNPLFEGETVYSSSEVLEKRESKSRPNVGIVRVKTTGFTEEGRSSSSSCERSWSTRGSGCQSGIPEPKR